MGYKHSLIKSFGYAFQGIRTAFKNEPNLRIQTSFAVFAVFLGLMLKLRSIEWLILLFIIFWVISLELMNTVLESIVNLVSPEIKPYARIAKDVSASVVLLGAILSLFVGAFLFLPKLIALFTFGL